jgi:hypothetical protein
MIDANILFTGGYDSTIKLTVINLLYLVPSIILTFDMPKWS